MPAKTARGSLFLFSIAAVGSWLLTCATVAHAFDRRQSASFCTAVASSFTGGSNPVEQEADGAIYDISTNTSGHILCPVMDDEQMRYWQVTGLNVHGRDDVTTAQAGVQACVRAHDNNTDTMVCGNQWVTGFSFHDEFTATPDLSVWQSHSADFAYIYVVLPQHGATSSQLRGFWFHN